MYIKRFYIKLSKYDLRCFFFFVYFVVEQPIKNVRFCFCIKQKQKKMQNSFIPRDICFYTSQGIKIVDVPCI